MDDEQFDDLKQFIETTVSQSEERLRGEISDLRQEMHEGFAGVGEALVPVNDQLDRHEKDIEQLKQHAA